MFVDNPGLFVGDTLLFESLAGLAKLVVQVDAFYGLFEAYGDEEAYDDGERRAFRLRC